MLKLRDLAIRSDFDAGPLHVSPSRRRVSGPAGEVHLEPLIMHVFLLLLDADGRVVTREELFNQCWGGVIVGDDSLNRAIAKVRRIAADVAPGLFEIETIPRTGYRLTGDIVEELQAGSAVAPARPTSHLSRRTLVAAGLGTAALAAGGLWWARERSSESEFERLMASGDEAFRDGTAFEGFSIRGNRNVNMMDIYQRAVQLKPDDARAWGLLAYFRSAAAEDATKAEVERVTAEAEKTLQTALALDPREPNARVGMFLLQGRTLSWIERDRQLRDILATDPGNLLAMSELMPLLQAAGLTRESWAWNERVLRASPFARPFLAVRAMKLWIMGRVRDCDSVIDRVRGLWPDFAFGYYVRMVTFALSGRPSAALAMLGSAPRWFREFRRVDMWQAALEALDAPSPATIAAARDACVRSARESPPSVNDAIMLLGALGFTETAFEVTEGFLLWRGKIVSANQGDAKAMDEYSRRMTQWLFTPPLADMRRDPRFAGLCEEFGLTEYWRARKVRPDYLVYG